ncbi:MAG: response regulator transcription factor [Alphaproteobacteria bacterium]|nr:response regulator transcription factor [Alphaproteobacteria bacterium]
MNKGIVLSVDDDEGLQTVLKHYLESENYVVATASNGMQLNDKLEDVNADVILLDLVLPDIDGLALIPQIRAKTQVPIIVLSGKSDTTEKIVCLEMGADDYMTKPFEMRELAARIKVVMRRNVSGANTNDKASQASSAKNETIKFGDFILDRNQFQLFDADNKSLEITTGEFQLLEALVLANNRALSREQLFELTRDGEFDSYDRAIDIQIGRLRKKLGDNGPNIIRTVRGVGYMFTPPKT